MAAKTLNIEIGDRLIRVCCTIPKRKGSRILDCFMFQTPQDCVSDGVIEDVETLAEALTRRLEEKGLSYVKNVVFSVSSGKIAAREVKLPPVKDKMIASVVATNAEEYFPVDLSGYHVTHSLLERASVPEKHLRVLVMAVPISLLEGYFALADKTGLTIRHIDSSGNSQYQVLRSLDEQGVTMYVEVDCTSSLVSVMKDGKLLLQRSFAFGGDELVLHYMRTAGKSAGQYVEALKELTLNVPSTVGAPAVTEEEVEANLGRLAGSIARSVDYFNSNRWDAHIQKIVLMGSCSKLVGLRELVVASTALPTVFLEDVPGAAEMTNSIESANSYIGCIGANLEPVNFMPDSLRSKGRVLEKKETLTAGILICVILIVGGLAFSGIAIINHSVAAKELREMQEEIEQLTPAEDVYFTYLSYQQGKEAVDTITSMTDRPNANLVAFYEELETKMPSSILLLSAVCTNDGISMNVTVGSYTDAAAVIMELRGFESISLVEVSGISRDSNEAGAQRVSFSINCAYGTNPYLEGINPYGNMILPEPEESPAGAAEESPAPAAE